MSAQPRNSDKGWAVGPCFLPSFQSGYPAGQGQGIATELHICSLLCLCLSSAWLRINSKLHSMEISLHQDRSCPMYHVGLLAGTSVLVCASNTPNPSNLHFTAPFPTQPQNLPTVGVASSNRLERLLLSLNFVHSHMAAERQ